MLSRLREAGLSDQVNSWLGQGGNETVNGDRLGDAIGEEKVEALAQESGMSSDEVKTGLSQILPGLVDKVSPSGQLPTSVDDLTAMMGQLPGGTNSATCSVDCSAPSSS